MSKARDERERLYRHARAIGEASRTDNEPGGTRSAEDRLAALIAEITEMCDDADAQLWSQHIGCVTSSQLRAVIES